MFCDFGICDLMKLSEKKLNWVEFVAFYKKTRKFMKMNSTYEPVEFVTFYKKL